MSNIFQRSSSSSAPVNYQVNAPSGSNVTLVSTDNPNQSYSPTANISVTLPTTGVLVGDIRRINNRNSSNFAVVVNSSSGMAITIAAGGNNNASIGMGQVSLMALVATPTAPSDWQVLDLEEFGTFTSSIVTDTGTPITATTARFSYCRNNFSVALRVFSNPGTIAGSANYLVDSVSFATPTNGIVPDRLRPDTLVQSVGYMQNGAGSLATAAGYAVTVFGGFQVFSLPDIGVAGTVVIGSGGGNPAAVVYTIL